jgi:hypothetical protein
MVPPLDGNGANGNYDYGGRSLGWRRKNDVGD